jgi:hypothetical protein
MRDNRVFMKQSTETAMIWKRRLGRPELNAVEARQGFLDRPVLLVLLTSTVLICLAFGILLLRY